MKISDTLDEALDSCIQCSYNDKAKVVKLKD